MTTPVQIALGLVLLAAGAVLALGFPEAELGWFDGRPLGTVLAIVGVLDVAEALWKWRSTERS